MSDGQGGLAPSKQQFAVALAATMVDDEKAIVYQPPGTGKTRSIISYVYLIAQKTKNAKIAVRFPNWKLKQQDMPAYDILKAIVPIGT